MGCSVIERTYHSLGGDSLERSRLDLSFDCDSLLGLFHFQSVVLFYKSFRGLFWAVFSARSREEINSFSQQLQYVPIQRPLGYQSQKQKALVPEYQQGTGTHDRGTVCCLDKGI